MHTDDWSSAQLDLWANRDTNKVGVHRHLFSGRYKSLVVDDSGAGYFQTVCDHVHLNPARAGGGGLLRAEQALREYRWGRLPQHRPVPCGSRD